MISNYELLQLIEEEMEIVKEYLISAVEYQEREKICVFNDILDKLKIEKKRIGERLYM